MWGSQLLEGVSVGVEGLNLLHGRIYDGAADVKDYRHIFSSFSSLDER